MTANIENETDPNAIPIPMYFGSSFSGMSPPCIVACPGAFARRAKLTIGASAVKRAEPDEPLETVAKERERLGARTASAAAELLRPLLVAAVALVDVGVNRRAACFAAVLHAQEGKSGSTEKSSRPQ